MSIQSTTSGLAALHSFFRTVDSSSPSKNAFLKGSPINAIQRLTTKISQVETSKRIQPLPSTQSAQSTVAASQANSNTNSRIQVTGVNDQQIPAVTITSLGSQNQLTIQGQVDRAADSAKLTVVGGNNATVTNSGQYLLTGNLGSATINLTAGESLDSVATRINQQTLQTGVIAAVQTNNLVLTSTQVGSRSTVSFRPTGPLADSVTGVDPRAIQSFNIVSQAAGTTDSLSGTVVSSADQARLVYHGGTGGTVKDTAAFRLTGSRGSLDVAIAQGESLTNVASRINQSTTSSGIIATVNGNDLSLTSDSRGASAIVQIDQVQRQESVSVTGNNSSQVSNVVVSEIEDGATQTLSGTVNQSATAASVALQGSTSGNVVDSATFQLTGSLGTSSISITQGESLTSVAARVNSLTSSTGVQAAVSSNQLVLKSTDVGSAANVAVQLTDITHTNVATGVNSQQLSNFQINSLTTGASETLSGTVNQTATAASVALQGSTSGNVIDSATFQLTGSSGSSSISITQGESLTSVAARVNSLTSSTGVQAAVSSNQLVLKSSDVGSAANVAVQLTDITHTNVATGVNSQQLSNFQINSLTIGASETLSGTVNQTATAASVALQGSTSGNVIDSATFQLTGSLGSSSISITQGESLTSVAARVNSLTSSTGVQAAISSNQLVLKSSDVGSAASIAVQLTDITHTNVATGVNSQQLSNFQINSLTKGASETLSGTINQTATAATVALQGSAGGNVIDTATFQLTGSLGSSSVSITQGESLTSVAARVNALTSSTGVQAQVSSNQLVLKSTNIGSSASIGAQLTNITHTNVVSGVNSQQLSNFQVNSFTTGASQTFSGSVTQTAGIGQLTFTGGLGLVGKNSTFTLSGSQGSVQLTTTTFESLSTLASQVNAATSTTGVQAVVSGSQLIFKTVGVGSSATIGINVTSGTFGVSGGNGNGTANGTNAVATINGQTLTGTGNSFAFSDSKGSYAFTAVAGFTGALNSVNVVSQAGQFSVTGGNGNGTANGTNAVATINGQTVTGTANAFQFSDSKGSYSFTAVAGFTGALNTVNVASQAGQFSVTGGHGDGTANGTNAVATINGQTVTGTGNAFQFTDSKGSFAFTTVAGFTGALNAVNVASQAGQFSVTGGHGDGTANGTNAVATINGQTISGTGNAFQFSDSKGFFAFTTVAGFAGALNSVNVASQSGQFSVTGGHGDGTANGTNAVATINGQTVTGTGNAFQFSDSKGTYSFTTAAGFQGSLTPIVVQSTLGSFDIQGGDGHGTAHGSDFVANLNGSTFTNTDNRVTVVGNHGTYDILFANGFTGGVNLSSTAKVDSVGVIASDSVYASSGTDASAVINGQERTAVGSLFTIRDDGALVTIKFADSFTGEFDPITATRIDSSADAAAASASIPGSNSNSSDQSSLQTQNRLVLLLAQQDIEFGQVLNKLKQLQSLSHESLAIQPKVAQFKLDAHVIEDTEVTREQTSKDESSDSKTVVAAKEQTRTDSVSSHFDAVV